MTRTILSPMSREREESKPFQNGPPRPSVAIPQEWLEEFEAAARRPLEVRFRYSFIRTYRPVLDDASFRTFDTMADYRRWCEENLPEWLGYRRVTDEEWQQMLDHALDERDPKGPSSPAA